MNRLLEAYVAEAEFIEKVAQLIDAIHQDKVTDADTKQRMLNGLDDVIKELKIANEKVFVTTRS